jgi:HTH-type transcriptional regulator, quorum sensing regulator NprR
MIPNMSSRRAPSETLGQRIRRLRLERGLSLAKVSGGDFTRAFLSQVELGHSQPSMRVLRVIAGRLDTQLDILLEGRVAGVDRELALERARVLVASGSPRRALVALAGIADSQDWPFGTDARLCLAEALAMLGRAEESAAMLAAEKSVISAHHDSYRLARIRSLQGGRPASIDAQLHLRLGERYLRAGSTTDALEHFRAARVLLEVRAPKRK